MSENVYVRYIGSWMKILKINGELYQFVPNRTRCISRSDAKHLTALPDFVFLDVEDFQIHNGSDKSRDVQ